MKKGMRRMLSSLLFVLLTCSVLAQSPVKVVGVTDGDTLTILTSERKQVKVRLDGVDAPEAKQPFGAAAKTWLSERAFGQTLKYKDVGKDRYGRSLGKFWIDGKRLDYHIVQSGMAWWYRKYSSDPILKQCEWEARQAKRGIWSQPNPVAPWDWRNDGQASASQRAFGRSTIKPQASRKVSTVVYVAATGSKYHRAGCRYLKKSAIPMQRSDAARNYEACKVCGAG